MLLPKKIKTVLERNRFYVKLRYSKWIHSCWLLFRADVRKDIRTKRAFYQSVLPHHCKLIFDIGANEGVLTDILSKHAQTVIAVEPSQRNVSILSTRFTNQERIIIVPEAVSNLTGYQPWYEDKHDYAMGTLNRKWNDSKPNKEDKTAQIATITLDDLIKQFGVPDYIKIDVEGYELQVLQGLLQTISLLSFEAILPWFLEETVLCIQYLVSVNPSVRFNYSIENKFIFNTYQTPDIILNDIKNIPQTIDIFCQL